METNLNVTPLETIRLASLGKMVVIPGFADGETFTVMLRKPNMLTLMKLGKIPNELMESANGLFDVGKNGNKQVYSTKDLADICKIMEAFCEASLAQPTYKELMDLGIELTQEQVQFIFNYAVGGVKSIKPFRDESGDSRDHQHGGDVSMPTEPVA